MSELHVDGDEDRAVKGTGQIERKLQINDDC